MLEKVTARYPQKDEIVCFAEIAAGWSELFSDIAAGWSKKSSADTPLVTF